MALTGKDRNWLDYWLPKAEAGDPDAQIAVGWEYFKARDAATAEHWFMAAEENLPETGYVQLLKMLIVLDDDRVRDLFAKTSWQSGAFYYLFGLYRRSKGADDAELIDLFSSGSERGHLPSRLMVHQRSNSAWGRMRGLSLEISLIARTLAIWWRNPNDMRVAH